MNESTEKPMTKTEVRAYLTRAREGIRWAEEALRTGSALDLSEAMVEATGSLAEIQGALDERYGRGVNGVTEEAGR